MGRKFTLEYWVDDEWYVGKSKEVPGVFSQGATLQELEENNQDAICVDMAPAMTSIQIRITAEWLRFQGIAK